MRIIYIIIFYCSVMSSCKEGSMAGGGQNKRPLTIENLQGSWASKPEGPAELKFEQDSIHFLDDQQSFKYMIVGDSIQFELEFATFWYKIELRGNDQMDFTTPQMALKYTRINN
ncbi:MAG: hypothetical protein IPM92_16875 [Saprospiraceae bacterium]|nr:hypothetical protein [Saprospiraceae bacterium]